MPLIDKEKLQISLMRIGCYDIADIVEDQPEVDAVEVVRCKRSEQLYKREVKKWQNL